MTVRMAVIAIALALLVMIAGGCDQQAADLNNQASAVHDKSMRAPTAGARIRMAWPGIEDPEGLQGDIVTLTIFQGDAPELSVIVEDANGKGIPALLVHVASANGNVISKPMAVTGNDGRVNVSITAKVVGPDVIHVSALGTQKQLQLNIRAVASTVADGSGSASNASPASAAGTAGSLPVAGTKAVLREVHGVLPWGTLADGVVLKDSGGVSRLAVTDAVRALNGKNIKLEGFVLPLEQAQKQKHFLLTANPPTCPFCLPGGPESIVEVRCDTPIPYTFEPVVLSGTLQVLDNSDLGLVYRLTGAKKTGD